MHACGVQGGSSVLYLAAQGGHVALVALLIERRANIDAAKEVGALL